MKFLPTLLPGLLCIIPDYRSDGRGRFTRTYCEEEFTAAGLNTHWPQCNISFNCRLHTLRGLHFQADSPEVKLVRCVAGVIQDVVVDIRKDSPTYGCCDLFTLTPEDAWSLYIPAGFAHGFLTLTEDSAVHYQMSVPYRAELARGIRWNDPALGIRWPTTHPCISERDAHLPFLSSIK